ncbi:MAG TPA: S9 family peptidase [Steroidobacteraceae bacterium]|nr:S9 family peptidase [Steroidobacteraceae bacterium]
MPLTRPAAWPLLCTLAVLPLLAMPASRARADAGGGPLTPEDLVMLRRVSDPQVAPGGRTLAFVERETDMAANRGHNAVWLLDLGRADAVPQRLTELTDNASSPRWAPDGRALYFLSSHSGSAQIWRLTPGAAAAQRVTDYPLDVGSFRVSPRGDALALAMEVFVDCATLGCTKERLTARSKEPARARIYERVFIRHWDTWSESTRSHLFAARLGADGAAGEPVDVSKGFDADIPGKPFGGDEGFAFSPDGRALVFSARIAGRTEPWSTNFDLFQVPADGSAAPVNLTADNPACDAQPVFLANGDLAWLAQERPGFESDRFHIVLKSARDGAVRALTGAWDRSVARLGATADGKWLLASADDLGQRKLYRIDPKSGLRFELVNSGEVDDYTASATHVVFARADLGGPNDLYQVAVKGGASKRLTEANRAVLGARRLGAFEQFSFKGWNDETVHGYVMQPYGFEPGKRFPVAFLVHGGPQSSFQNLWVYRWNAQAFAAAGYGVVMIDFHGSPGYGQAFTDSISRDWGGKPLVDLQKGLEAALARYPWLDGERACALGASYGGFMMNWIEGHWPERFRCIVNHDGVFDQRMMYYSTEELWFPEWEFGGPYYQNPEGYERWNPVEFVAKWRTPMLVIHGEQDFRIPYSQGVGAFTALQRRGIESKLVVFPDEDHWVLKPADSVLWYHTVFGWLDAHLKN